MLWTDIGTQHTVYNIKSRIFIVVTGSFSMKLIQVASLSFTEHLLLICQYIYCFVPVFYLLPFEFPLWYMSINFVNCQGLCFNQYWPRFPWKEIRWCALSIIDCFVRGEGEVIHCTVGSLVGGGYIMFIHITFLLLISRREQKTCQQKINTGH